MRVSFAHSRELSITNGAFDMKRRSRRRSGRRSCRRRTEGRGKLNQRKPRSDYGGLGVDEFRNTPRQAPQHGRAVEGRLNRLATALNFAFEELSEIRHDLGIAERADGWARRKVEEPAGE